jgi:hypothetical protein
MSAPEPVQSEFTVYVPLKVCLRTRLPFKFTV